MRRAALMFQGTGSDVGKTVLVATHDLPLIRSAKAQVAVRVMRLTEGRIVVAVTNRRSMWSLADNKPFGHGRPCRRHGR